jgi:hypothetical protein
VTSEAILIPFLKLFAVQSGVVWYGMVRCIVESGVESTVTVASGERREGKGMEDESVACEYD